MKNRGVQIRDVMDIFHRQEAQLVRGPDRLSAFDSRSGQPHREPVYIVIPAWFADSLASRSAAEFPAPNEQRLFPQPAAFQVIDQRGDGLVGFARMELVVRDAIGVAVPSVFDVPAAGIELDKADAPFLAGGG